MQIAIQGKINILHNMVPDNKDGWKMFCITFQKVAVWGREGEGLPHFAENVYKLCGEGKQ